MMSSSYIYQRTKTRVRRSDRDGRARHYDVNVVRLPSEPWDRQSGRHYRSLFPQSSFWFRPCAFGSCRHTSQPPSSRTPDARPGGSPKTRVPAGRAGAVHADSAEVLPEGLGRADAPLSASVRGARRSDRRSAVTARVVRRTNRRGVGRGSAHERMELASPRDFSANSLGYVQAFVAYNRDHGRCFSAHLVVDDEDAIRELLAYGLRGAGFEVRSAPDGRAAFR